MPTPWHRACPVSWWRPSSTSASRQSDSFSFDLAMRRAWRGARRPEVRLRREHGITAALGVGVVLALIDLQWSYTLHYKLAQPDFYVYYLAAQLGRAPGWAAIYDPGVFLPPVTAAVGKPLPYLNPPELAWLVTPLSYLPYTLAGWIWTGLSAGTLGLPCYLVAPGRGLVRVIHGVGAAAVLPVFVGILFGQVSLVVVVAVAIAW